MVSWASRGDISYVATAGLLRLLAWYETEAGMSELVCVYMNMNMSSVLCCMHVLYIRACAWTHDCVCVYARHGFHVNAHVHMVYIWHT